MLTIQIDTQVKGESYEHFLSKVVGAGHTNEALRESWLQKEQQVQQNYGFEYVRFHGIFHDDMFSVFIARKGNITYNCQYIDDVFDRLLDLNVKPFVELAFLPDPLAADHSKTVFWWKANITPKEESFEMWYDLIKAFAQHCVNRYATDEVPTWYFEVWNEPNLYPLFWDGKKTPYFELYKQSAIAVKSIDNRLKIGGPSTSNFVPDNRFDVETTDDTASKAIFNAKDINTLEWHDVWVEDFLKYCKKEKLPVDFVTTYPYPTDYAFNPETYKGRGLTRFARSTKLDLEWLNNEIKKGFYPNAEIHFTEWNTSPGSRDKCMIYFLKKPLVKSDIDCICVTNSLAFWTFTDIFGKKGGATSIFHGGFVMTNYQGLVKPSYHAYRMLNQLGYEKLYKGDYLFIIRDSDNKKIKDLAYNYAKEAENQVPVGYKGYEYLKEGTAK